MDAELWDRVVAWVSAGGPLVVLLGSTVAALAVGVIFDRVGRRLASGTRTELDDLLIEHLRGPVSATVFSVGAWYALGELGLPEFALWLAQGVLFSGGVAVWALGIGRGSSRMLDWMARNRERYPTVVTNRTLPVFDMAGKLFIGGGTVYFLLLAWGVDLTAWIASAGILGVAVGFASQDTLANLVSGVFILADAPYKIGDWVVLDSGERGQVTEIGMRTTRLRTRDDIVIILPNKVMANARIQNQSTTGPTGFRVRARVNVAYGTELASVQAELVAVAKGIEGVLADPEPRVRLRALGPDGLEHEVLFWVKDPATRGLVLHRALGAIYARLNELGVTIPFPQREVHLRERGTG